MLVSAQSGAAQTAPLLVAVVVLYYLGWRRARRSGSSASRAPLLGFALGWLMVTAALISPIHAMAEEMLSAHMAQHVLLIMAPLPLALGHTSTRILQALAPTWRAALVSRLRASRSRRQAHWAALAALLGTTLFWHLPPVFEAATANGILHAAEHATLLGAAGVYGPQVVRAGVGRRGHGAALASVSVLFVAGSLTGALLTFSTVPWYPRYSSPGDGWLADQQLAGVVMTVPMGVVLMLVAAWLAWSWSAGSSSHDAHARYGTRVSVGNDDQPAKDPGRGSPRL